MHGQSVGDLVSISMIAQNPTSRASDVPKICSGREE